MTKTVGEVAYAAKVAVDALEYLDDVPPELKSVARRARVAVKELHEKAFDLFERLESQARAETQRQLVEDYAQSAKTRRYDGD